ncbi:hypothetical protein ACH0C8_16545, partial [Acetobacter lovaniensis]|uniref:hypothetical protein n=1 Tax=Acetobacter lovaniensis TaxID=104100 RepID=UPI00376FA387
DKVGSGHEHIGFPQSTVKSLQLNLRARVFEYGRVRGNEYDSPVVPGQLHRLGSEHFADAQVRARFNLWRPFEHPKAKNDHCT